MDEDFLNRVVQFTDGLEEMTIVEIYTLKTPHQNCEQCDVNAGVVRRNAHVITKKNVASKLAAATL